MREASVSTPPLIEWGVATLALPGEAQSGDLHLVQPAGTGVLVAVVLLLVLLPQYSRTVLVAGTGFTVVTYFLQAVLRSSFEPCG